MSMDEPFRETPQRRVILEELTNSHEHPTADGVYELVRKRRPRISLGTVYRNLELMADRGCIRRIHWAGGPRRYDSDTREHCHVRCTRCGQVSDIECGPHAELEDIFRHNTDYKITGHRLELIGLCPECQREDAREAGEG